MGHLDLEGLKAELAPTVTSRGSVPATCAGSGLDRTTPRPGSPGEDRVLEMQMVAEDVHAR